MKEETDLSQTKMKDLFEWMDKSVAKKFLKEVIYIHNNIIINVNVYRFWAILYSFLYSKKK